MMSKIKRQPTLINAEYLKGYSMFPNNYDLTDVENFIPVAEQIHILPILGISLYEELLEQVTSNTLTDENSTLLLEVYKVEGIAVLYESLPFVWAHVSSVGITKGKSDNSDSLENRDLAYLNTHIKAQLDYAKQYLKNWLDEYQINFPLYKKDDDECCKKIDSYHLDIYRTKKDNIDLI